MKHFKLLLALVVSMFTLNISAQDASAFAEGKYYLQNVTTGKFWGAGNSWGTQASLVANPEYVTLHPNGSIYRLESQVSNGGTAYYFNGDFMDNDSPVNLTITPIDGTSYYTIAQGTNYYGYDGTSTVLGKNLDGTSSNAQWAIFTEEEMLANLSNASSTNPVNATFLFKDCNFGRNNRNTTKVGDNNWTGVWSMTATNQNLHAGANENMCAESFHCPFTLSQQSELTAPAGFYKLTAQGFYREDGWGTMTEDRPYIFINDTKVATFNLMTGSENSMNDASASFTNGKYIINGEFFELTSAGTITIGAKLENCAALWCIWDNFTLMYYGAEKPTIYPLYQTALQAAQDVDQTAAMYAVTLSNLQGTISTYGSLTSSASDADLQTAIDALEAATNAANASIAAYAKADVPGYLAKMGGVLELTNVYTQAAYDQWVTNIQTAMDNHELADDVASTINPDGAYSGGWHAANHIDEVLLSAWTIGGEVPADYTKALYINTWSVEGNSDGSGMTTPFFEYWTGDGDQLGANTIQAKVPGLDPKKNYKVSILVRVRQQNGNTKADNGITLTVGNGTAVNAADGKETVYESSIFYYKTVEAYGQPDSEGNLTITLTVNANSHISWLSFKNAKYEEVDISQDMINELYASIKTPHNVKLDAAVASTKAAVESSFSTEDFVAFQEAVGAVNASADEYATVKTALDEAEAVYATLIGLPTAEDALYQVIMNGDGETPGAIYAYQNGLIESSPQIGTCNAALAYIEQGIRRIVIKQQGEGAVIDRGYPESNLSGTDKLTGNVQVAPDGLAPWMISESRAYTWHVNTWSGEGAEDGSGMLTPFLEYWRGGVDRVGLDDVTISNTLTSQSLGGQNVTLYPNSVYEVSGQIRAYMEYTATGNITGVRIFAGDFESDLSDQAETKVSNNKALIYGTFTVKGNTDASGNLTFGVKTQSTTANWIAAKNFSIKYISNNVDDLYKEAYEKMLAKAQADINDEEYADVVGAERDLLLDVISNDENVPTPISYKQGYDNLKDADDAFIAAKPAYDALAKAKSDATATEWPYASEEKLTALTSAVEAEATDAADAATKADAIIAAYRLVVESNGVAEGVADAVNVTTSLASYDAAVSNWSGIGTNQGQGYTYSDGALYAGKYYDGGWSSSTGVNVHVSQDVTLPQGKYLLQISARSAFDMTSYTLSAFNGETELASVVLPSLSADANAGIFKNGWEDRYIVFDVTENNATTIKIDATSELTQRWISFNNLRLIRLELSAVMADAADYAALNAAIEAAEGKTLGFDEGEYAPYINKEALIALEAAKAIDQTVDNTKDAVTEATSALENAVWTANTEEVNGIFDGQFATTEANAISGDITLPGWTKVQGIRLLVKDQEDCPGLAYTDGKAAVFSWGGTTLTYGAQTGYTLPLNKDELYELTLKVSGWKDGDLPTAITAKLDDAQASANPVALGAGRINQAEGNPFVDIKLYLTPTADGNSTLTITGNKHFAIADLCLKHATAIEIDENADYDNTVAADGAYVSLTRTITASTTEQKNYNSLVLPFDLTEDQIKAAFGNDVKVYAYTGDENNSVKFEEATEITANTPVLLTTSTASTEDPYIFQNVDIKAATEAVAKGTDIDFVGTYAASTSLVGKYFISGNNIYEGTDATKPMKGTRAYFTANSGAVNALSLNIDGETITAIQGIDGTITPKAIYNLQGQKVNNPVKGGIYIIDGKKTLVK